MHEVLRYDRGTVESDPTLRSRLVEWVRSLGLDPDELLPDAVIVMGMGEYELHVSQIVRKEDGSRWVDEARLELVSKPVVVGLGQNKSWPAPRHRVAS